MRVTSPTGQQLEALVDRVAALELLSQQHTTAIGQLREENADLKRRVLETDLARVKAHTKPLSVQHVLGATRWLEANLLTVARLQGFENLIAHCIIPCTGNRRFAGKVGWNKLQKTCRALRATPVPLEMDPSVRIVPDNFPTIRRAVQNVDKNDKLDNGRIIVRHRASPYTEQIVIDRRVTLLADPDAAQPPLIQGRISLEDGAGGSIIRGFAVSNNNPRDPWGSAIDVSGVRDVLIENCELSSSANDETILNLHSGCLATVRRNTIRGGQAPGVTGISVHAAAVATISENCICDNDVGVRLPPSAKVTLKQNRLERNQKGIQLNEEDIDRIVEQGGFGRLSLQGNTFVENRDGHTDRTFLKSLELLLHPLLRRFSLPENVFPEHDAEDSRVMGTQT